jgi:3-oxoadipate enol-lactonase
MVAPDDGRAILVGESFGGTVVVGFTLAHPERVSALVVLNSFAHFKPQVRLRAAILGLSMLPWGAMRVVRRLTAFRLHSPHTHRAEIRKFIELTAATTRNGYRNRLRLLRRYDVRSRLHEITRPTLFLAAECDHLIPSVEQAKLMSARVSGAAMRVLEGHGHICLINDDVDPERILRTKLFPGGTPTLRRLV